MTSCNSTIRQARSLFSEKVVELLPELRLPDPAPFRKIKFFPRQNTKYFSRIDPQRLIQEANDELRESDPPVFLTMLIALSAGLRRGEIDSLKWNQVDFKKRLIRVESTDAADIKTVDSRAEVPIDAITANMLFDFFKMRKGAFVIDGGGISSGPQNWGRKYRANAVFERVNEWLRDHGVDRQKPLHELRKELGALATALHGIYAASRLLRHSNIATTEAHYADLKTRPVVDIGAWLIPAKKSSVG
jgi:integrase